MLPKKFSVALLALGGMLTSAAAMAALPKPYDITPDLVAAAKKEGKVVFYTSTDLAVSEKVAAEFQKEYPGISVQVERSGAERVFQRIGQEYSAGIHNVDVVDSSDAVNFVYFKQHGWLAQALPKVVADKWPKAEIDPDGDFAAYRATLCVVAYRTDKMDAKDLPKTWEDMLDPRFKGKMVKAHPGYSGTIMTATFVLSHKLGWDYFKKLGQQQVMQVQSSTEPPKILAQGERPMEFDGNEYNVFQLQEKGTPIKIIYFNEGTPIVVGNAGLMKDAPHPNAGKLFYAYLFSTKAQQLGSDFGGLRSFNPDVKEKSTRTPLSKIKVLTSDPAKLEKEITKIKSNYEKYFGT
ncbi:MAG TPA: extracellular solute-binding protein [Stellaceae bacterium]|jgi:iron(III) transport system substrate-binding protein|nr:extracellular solute-binding protein [Stellaceae bacterium]